MDSRYYSYEDFLAEVQDRLPKITHEEVNTAIRKFLNFKNLYLAIITDDAQSFKEALVANTPSPISYANPNMPPEILEEDLIYQTFALDVNPEKVRIIKASEFFKKEGIPR
jgi:zinc protease